MPTIKMKLTKAEIARGDDLRGVFQQLQKNGTIKKPKPAKPVYDGDGDPPEGGWKNACTELAKCVIWALKFDKHIGKGSGLVVQFEDGKPDLSQPMKPWQEKFFDALDLVGLKYDRKGYYENKAHKRRAR